MEIVLVLCVLAALMLIIGFDISTIIACGVFLLAAGIILMFLLFAFSLIAMLSAKMVMTDFVKIDKSPRGRFDVAYYKFDGKEYPCAFPSEPLMRRRIYAPDKAHRVRLNRRTGTVYDRYASITCVLGFVFSGLLTAGIIWLALSFVTV